jgi:hypothetical protein
MKGREHLGDIGLDGKFILKWSVKISCEDVGWIHLYQDTDQWWAPLNVVMNFQVL